MEINTRCTATVVNDTGHGIANSNNAEMLLEAIEDIDLGINKLDIYKIATLFRNCLLSSSDSGEDFFKYLDRAYHQSRLPFPRQPDVGSVVNLFEKLAPHIADDEFSLYEFAMNVLGLPLAEVGAALTNSSGSTVKAGNILLLKWYKLHHCPCAENLFFPRIWERLEEAYEKKHIGYDTVQNVLNFCRGPVGKKEHKVTANNVTEVTEGGGPRPPFPSKPAGNILEGELLFTKLARHIAADEPSLHTFAVNVLGFASNEATAAMTDNPEDIRMAGLTLLSKWAFRQSCLEDMLFCRLWENLEEAYEEESIGYDTVQAVLNFFLSISGKGK